MKKTEGISLGLKILILLVLDILTFIFVFSVWTILKFPLFPFALVAIIVSLILTNLFFLLSKKISTNFGLPVSVTVVASTFLYYLFVVAFTWLTYPVIRTRNYSIVNLFAFMLYLLVILGVYFMSVNTKKTLEVKEVEEERTLDLQFLMMATDNKMRDILSKKILDESDYRVLKDAKEKAFERLHMSTPFGRIDKKLILGQEERIKYEISKANDLLDGPIDKENCDEITTIFNEVYNLAKNREKLI